MPGPGIPRFGHFNLEFIVWLAAKPPSAPSLRGLSEIGFSEPISDWGSVVAYDGTLPPSALTGCHLPRQREARALSRQNVKLQFGN